MEEKFKARISAAEDRVKQAEEKLARANERAKASLLEAAKARKQLGETTRKQRDSVKFILGSLYLEILTKQENQEAIAKLKERHTSLKEEDLSLILLVLRNEKERMLLTKKKEPPQSSN